MSKFKVGNSVEVAQHYLVDEVTSNYDTSPIAIVLSEPSDEEELVCIRYTSGDIDYVPQDILEII